MENAQAQSGTTLKEKLNNYTWKKRVLLVIAPATDNEQLQQQQVILSKHQAGLQDRDMEIIYLPMDKALQEDKTFLSQQFNIGPDDFYSILIGKDGTEKLRSTTPMETEKLFGTIDAMPMRRREMRNE
jgi:hypothetical protein